MWKSWKDGCPRQGGPRPGSPRRRSRPGGEVPARYVASACSAAAATPSAPTRSRPRRSSRGQTPRIARQKGLSTFGKGVTSVLRKQGLMKALAKSGGTLSRLLFKKLPEDSGLRLRFPAPFISPTGPCRRSPPNRSARPVPGVHPGRHGAADRRLLHRLRHQLHVPGDRRGAAQALRFLGVTVVIPKEQGCCGLPAVSAGAGATVEDLAAQNLEALTARPVDWSSPPAPPATPASVKSTPSWARSIGRIGAKVKDIFVFLVGSRPAGEARGPAPAEEASASPTTTPVTCAPRGSPGSPARSWRRCRRSSSSRWKTPAPAAGWAEPTRSTTTRPARRSARRRPATSPTSGAELVATDCPGCIMQLQDSINHAGGRQRAVHILELLDQALPALSR